MASRYSYVGPSEDGTGLTPEQSERLDNSPVTVDYDYVAEEWPSRPDVAGKVFWFGPDTPPEMEAGDVRFDLS